MTQHSKTRTRVMLWICASFLALTTGATTPGQSAEPFKFFREYVGLNDEQIAAIRNGKAIAKIVESRTPDEVFVFGAVYVESTPDKYLKFASDIDSLRKLPNYLAIRKFSDPPQLSDLEGFSLEPEDIKDLKNCEPEHCNVQLPDQAMDSFKRSVDWSAPDVANRVNQLARTMALDALLKYIQGGNAALGTYRDKKHPAVVATTFESLLSRSKALRKPGASSRRRLAPEGADGAQRRNVRFEWQQVRPELRAQIP